MNSIMKNKSVRGKDMNISEMAKLLNAETLSFPEPELEVVGCYCGDLLSWVMGRAQEEQIWITIMTNINVIAVASLSGVSAVLISEGAEIEADVLKKAEEQGINVLRTSMSTFEAAVAVGKLLSK